MRGRPRHPEKICTGCGKGRPAVEFYDSHHTTRCKPCWRAYQRERYIPVGRRDAQPDTRPTAVDPSAACELDALTRGWTLPGFVAPAFDDDGPSEVELAAARLKAAA
jgi:hypothetical protein